jgi:hypothetical protein
LNQQKQFLLAFLFRLPTYSLTSAELTSSPEVHRQYLAPKPLKFSQKVVTTNFGFSQKVV